MRRILICAASLFLLAGCSPAPVQRPPLQAIIQEKITLGSVFKKTNFEPSNLPADIFREQIREAVELDGIFFAFALQQSSGVWIHRNGKGLPVTWAGILASRDGGQSWERFVKITNSGAVPYNPIGLLAQDGKLYADFQNYSGAGSGEGFAVRFVTLDGGITWKPDSCFYAIPETYAPEKPIEKIAYLKAMDPGTSLKFEKCDSPLPSIVSSPEE